MKHPALAISLDIVIASDIQQPGAGAAWGFAFYKYDILTSTLPRSMVHGEPASLPAASKGKRVLKRKR